MDNRVAKGGRRQVPEAAQVHEGKAAERLAAYGHRQGVVNFFTN